MAENKPKSAEERLSEAGDPTKVKALQAEDLTLSSILRKKLEIKEADRQSQKVGEAMSKLTEKQLKEIEDYRNTQKTISDSLKKQQQLQADIANFGEKKNKKDREAYAKKAAELKSEISLAKRLADDAKEQEKTQAVALSNLKSQYDIKSKGAKTELELAKKIKNERGGYLGSKIGDMFRTNAQKQLSIEIARANAGGGIAGGGGIGGAGGGGGTGGGGTGGGKGGDDLEKMGKLGAIIAGLKGPMDQLKTQARAAIVAPFAEAAGLLTGDSIGMGGGKANAAGATSILGGMKDLAATIPLVGGLLSGLLGVFKGIADAVLGIDQANYRVGRSLNISADAANDLRKKFDSIASASGNIVVNSTRLLQSEIEINKQLGTNAQLRSDILVNDVKLRDIAGLEAESRQQIANSSIITGRNAEKLTQSVMGTVGGFNKLVGTSFKFNDIMSEASKLSGVMGLTFSKYPEKITNAVLATKTLGFELKQLDSSAGSFLDFEGSISKEMEAQVLTGKDMNLTRAREAALNNDNATLAQEITKNIGSANNYLKMNRIQQEAIAGSVGMTRDSLADVLKKQELYTKLGATDVKTFNEKIELLQKQGKTQEQISAMIGKDAYNTFTQVSTAEKLTEIMERIKIAVVDFVKNTGLFDFLTKPEKINAFITGLTDRLGGFIKWIGNAIATLLEGLGSFVSIFSSDTGSQLKSIAAEARGGSAELGSSIQSIGANLGGAVSNSVSGTKEAGAQKEAAKSQQAVQQTGNGQPMNYGPQTVNVGLNIDGYHLTSKVVELTPQVRQATH